MPGGFAQSGMGLRECCENRQGRMGNSGVAFPFATHRLDLAVMLAWDPEFQEVLRKLFNVEQVANCMS